MRPVIRELFETVILALLIFLGFHLSIGNYRVEGSSMVPSLEEGEYVIVNKLVYSRPPVDLLPFVGEPEDPYLFHGPRRGEVIIFEFPRDLERDFVKRVIGLPGDTVEIKRGQVIVNDIELDEPYITHQSTGSYPKTTVPGGSYFVWATIAEQATIRGTGDPCPRAGSSAGRGSVSGPWTGGRPLASPRRGPQSPEQKRQERT